MEWFEYFIRRHDADSREVTLPIALDFAGNFFYACAGGERSEMRSYRAFLFGTNDTLVDLLAALENMEWHHKDPESPEWKAYELVAQVLQEIEERTVRYGEIKGPRL